MDLVAYNKIHKAGFECNSNMCIEQQGSSEAQQNTREEAEQNTKIQNTFFRGYCLKNESPKAEGLHAIQVVLMLYIYSDTTAGRIIRGTDTGTIRYYFVPQGEKLYQRAYRNYEDSSIREGLRLIMI